MSSVRLIVRLADLLTPLFTALARTYSVPATAMFRRVVILVAIALPLAAQGPLAIKRRQLIRRADNETSAAIIDSRGLSRFEKPLFFARLVDAWAKEGNRDLRSWTRLATDGLTKNPNDRPEEDRQRLVVAAHVYRIVAPVDRDAAAKVLDTMLSGLDELGDQSQITEPEREEFDEVGSALADAAARAAADDPAKADALAHTIMSLHQGGALASLIASLQKTQTDLAGSILADSIESASATLDARYTTELARVLFLPKNAATLTEAERTRVFHVVEMVLAQPPANDAERREQCKLAAVAGQITRKLQLNPLALATDVNDSCTMLETSLNEASAPSAPQLKTAGDFLQAALTALKARDRAWYRMHAAQMFLPTDPVTAIATAAAMAPDERAVYPAWRHDFLDVAVGAGEKFHRAGNATAVDQVLAATPPRLRPVVAVRLATWALNQSAERDFAVKMLTAARQSIDRKLLDDADMLVALVNGYARLSSGNEDTQPVLPAGVTTDRVLFDVAGWLNDVPHPTSLWRTPADAHAAIVNNNGKALAEFPPLGDAIRPAKLDVTILNAGRFDDDIQPVRDPADRVSLRLGLIHRCLEAAAALDSR